VPNFVSVAPPLLTIPRRKIAYSVTQSVTQLIWYAGKRSFCFGI